MQSGKSKNPKQGDSEGGNDNQIDDHDLIDEADMINEDDLEEVIEIEDGDPDELEVVMEDLDVDDSVSDDRNDEEGTTHVDDACVVFSKHSGSVFTVRSHPSNPSLAVTGGEDDKAFLWKTDTGDVIHEYKGHKDSVIFTDFSHDGKYIATADMSGVIQVWKASSGVNIWLYECSDIEWVQWHPAASVLIAGTEEGDIYMWKVPSGDCKIFSGHGQKTTAGVILPDGKQVFSGYFDGSLKLVDLKTSASTFHVTGDISHSGPVTCVTCSNNGTLLLSGSVDSTIKIFNSANGKLVASFDAGFAQASDDSEPPSIECVAFSHDQTLACSGSLSGVLAIWDISAQRLRHQCKHPAGSGITKLAWDSKSFSHIYTAGLDGIVRLWDIRSGICEKTWYGHEDNILDISVSKNATFFLTSSDDGTARVFKHE